MSNNTPEDDRTIVNPAEISSGEMQPTMAYEAPTPAPAAAKHDGGNALPVGTYLDEFELRSVAGEGGFSIVYRAWDHSLNRQVAVKEYMPSGLAARVAGQQVSVRSERHRETFEAGLKSFVDEARLLAHFDHPALIKVYRFWKGNGTAYMVMPFCEGITLRDEWRSRSESPDEMELLTLLDPLTEAMAVMHAENWYHRDIAPDNVILLAGTRRPLLLDFGAARRVIGDMTHALTVILKPGYAPIEQWGEVPGMQQGAWTDIYALAAMIHFAIMRRTPPPSVGRLVNDNYEPLERAAAGRYSERFLQAVDHALAVRPEQRTQSIAQFRAEIGLADIARERTMTWMPVAPAAATSVAAQPTLMSDATVRATPLAPVAPSPSSEANEPTRIVASTRPPATVEEFQFEPPTRTIAQPPAAPVAPARRSGLLFAVGAAAAAALGVAGYVVLKPAAKPPTPAPAPSPTPDAASKPVPRASDPDSAPPPPPPSPPPLPGPFDVVDEFARIVKAQSAGFVVEVTLSKTTLRSDKDKLTFSIRSERDGYLYVFNHGSDNTLLQLYPNEKSGNPRLRKGQTVRLPTDVEFVISGPTGPSEVLAMVSTFPRDHTAFSSRKEQGFTFYPTGPEASALAARHKGPLPWIAGTPRCPTASGCNDEFGAAVVTFNVVQ